jgi:hypothetical protein
MVSRVRSRAGTAEDFAYETTRGATRRARDTERQALAACLKMFIDGTCLFGFLVFGSYVRPGIGSIRQQVQTSIVGNLKMTLLENNFCFNLF